MPLDATWGISFYCTTTFKKRHFTRAIFRTAFLSAVFNLQ